MSRAFLVGGAGFIGRRVVAAFAEAGEEAAAPSRDDFDIAQGAPEALAEKLAGVEVVVNCAGLGRDGRVDNLRAAHVDGPTRLAAACRIAAPNRPTDGRPARETTGTPCHSASIVVVPALCGNGSSAMSIVL